MLINGIKFACNTCVKGHRSSNCNHIERPLFEIRKKGRPVTQCAFCRDLRKTKQIHIKCTCTTIEKSIKSFAGNNTKSSDIGNTATTAEQQEKCYYQCPPSSKSTKEQGISFSESIQSSLLIDNGNAITTQKDNGAAHCTCHEAANKVLLYNNQHQPQGVSMTTTINKSRGSGMIIDEQKISNKACARFLDGQTKSPRRKSSTSSTSTTTTTKRRSIQNGTATSTASPVSPNYQPQQQPQPQQQDDAMMVDMDMFLYNSSHQEPELLANMINFPSNISGTTLSSTSSSTTPNYATVNNNQEELMMDLMDRGDMMSGLIMTDPDELTTLLNNVLNDKCRQDEVVMTDVQQQQQPLFNTAMTRSTTNNSISSSSSASFVIVPQQHLICGSFTPHANCSGAMDTQGESVVITITPLSAKDDLLVGEKTKPMTRIVTCFCGTSCICPGCFVHPNNYLDHYSGMQQFQQQTAVSTSSSSSCSSDDEEQYHHHQLNYTVSPPLMDYSSSSSLL